MLNFRSSTNTKPVKELGMQVIAGPSQGTVKLTPDAYNLIGCRVKDFAQILFEQDSKTAWLLKGADNRGGKLACANKSGGGIFTLNSKGAWLDLGGKENFNRHFDVLVEEVVYVSFSKGEITVVEKGAEGAIPAYKLEFVEEVAKAPRKKAEKAETTDEAQVTLEEGIAEVTPSTTGDSDQSFDAGADASAFEAL